MLTDRTVAKAHVLAGAMGNLVVDLLLPTIVYLALTPTGMPVAVRLAIGGWFVAGKAVGGRTESGNFRWITAIAVALLPTLIAAAAYVSGAGPAITVILGTVVAAVIIATATLMNRASSTQHSGIDRVALLVLIEVGISVVLTLISNDPRFIVARPAFYTASVGIFALVSLRSNRPLMADLTKPMAAAGNPTRGEAFERALINSAEFRRIEQWMTAGLAAVLIAESVLRVAIVYGSDQGTVLVTSVASQIPGVALIVVYVAILKIRLVPRAQKIVDAEMLAIPVADSDPRAASPVVS